MLQMPDRFRVPRAGQIRFWNVLIGHVPATIAAGHNIHQPRIVALVAIVIVGEQVAVLINCELLRISQSLMNAFKFSAIWIATINHAASRVGNRRPFFGDDMAAAITDRKIQFAIDAPDKSVQVVPIEPRIDSKTFQQRCLVIGPTIVVIIVQQPQVGNARVPDFAVPGDDSRTKSVERTIEAIGEHGRLICLAVCIAVNKLADDVRRLCEPRDSFIKLVGPLLLHRQPIRQSGDLQVIVQHEVVRTILGSAFQKPMILRDIDTAVFVKTKRDRICKHWIRREQFGSESIRQPKRSHRRSRRLSAIRLRVLGQGPCRQQHDQV